MAVREAVAEKPVQTIDILPHVEKFPPQQRKFLLNNLVSFELNHGCSSGCADCGLGANRGVASKVSFDSFKKFIETYKDELPSELTPHYATEPFDYRDGEHGIADIYKVIKENRPEIRVFLSTYFPEGSEEEMAKLAAEMIKNSVDQNRRAETLRISIRQWGDEARQKERDRIIERVQAVRKKVEETLVDDKYREKIKTFFEDGIDDEESGGLNVLSVESGRQALHNKYAKRSADTDMISSETGISCYDGVVLGPNGFRSVVMDALSENNPLGITQWDIEPGSEFEAPSLYRSDYAVDFKFAASNFYMFGQIVPVDGMLLRDTHIARGDNLERSTRVSFSREIRAFRTVLKTYSHWAEALKQHDPSFALALYRQIRYEYMERKHVTQRWLANEIPDGQQIYIEAFNLYIKFFDYLIADIDAKLKEQKISPLEIGDVFAEAADMKSADIIALTSSAS